MQVLLFLVTLLVIGIWFVFNTAANSEYQPLIAFTLGTISILGLGLARMKISESSGKVKITEWLAEFQDLPPKSNKEFTDTRQAVVGLFNRQLRSSNIPYSIIRPSRKLGLKPKQDMRVINITVMVKRGSNIAKQAS